MDFSLIFFSGDGTGVGSDKYELLFECARFADDNGFAGIFTPERHFQAVGGLFPNPSVLSAALAMITKRIQLRAGSVVLPLHDVLRVAEEWSVVDNLSNGRAAISFATGWHPADFILRPTAYDSRRKDMLEGIEQVRSLWRGESVPRLDISGCEVQVRSLPRPIQRELPFYITSSGNPATWELAGTLGANVLCSLSNHTVAHLKECCEIYKLARAAAGYEEDGVISVMVHTRVGESDAEVKELVRKPMRKFLNEFVNQNDTLNPLKENRADITSAIDNERDALLTYAFEKHFNLTALLGSVEKCGKLVDRLADAGATEIACMLDFGLARNDVVAGFDSLLQLVRRNR